MRKTLTVLMIAFIFQSCDNKIEKHDNNPAPERVNGTKIKDTTRNGAPPIKTNDLLFDVEGNYTLKQHEVTDCKIFLSLFYKNGVLKYDLETNTRKLSGIAKLELNEKKDGYYITFKNIEWSENLGAINFENDTAEADLPLPQDVQGALYKNEITIQNSGNAMNYYVKIGECDLKFIHLIK